MIEARPWRVVFFGSSDFAGPALEALARGPDDLVLAITPPPAPAGRGRRLRPCPAAEKAGALGCPVMTVRTLKGPEMPAAVAAYRPDLLVVAAFGGFLPPALLSLTPWPPLNIHPSLLPRHRGPAPVNWGLIQGDPELGVSIIFLEEEMDAGPVLRRRAFPATGAESAGAWEARLAAAGAEELMAAIAALKSGRFSAEPQNPALVTVNPKLAKADGRVDFRRPAAVLAALINGVDPWPGAAAALGSQGLKLFGAEAVAVPAVAVPAGLAEPGRVLGLDERGRLLVAAGEGVLAVAEIQPQGKKRLKAADFARGYRPEILGL